MTRVIALVAFCNAAMATVTKGGAAFPASMEKPGIATPLCLMTKKDSEKEVERPHYYSQFWLDVAAGRRVIGTPKPEDGTEDDEPEMAQVAVARNPVRDSMSPSRIESAPLRGATDGYQESLAPDEVEPMFGDEEYAEPELREDLVGAVDDLDIPNIVMDEPEIPQVPVAAQEEEGLEPEEELMEPFFEDEEEEEEEDWNVGRGRKKAKPSRPTKQPPKRQEKRRRY